MFSDPFSNLMLVLLLFFCGLLVMFIFMMRNLESHWRNQEETRLQLALHLSDLETKLDALLRLAGAAREGGPLLMTEEPGERDFPGRTAGELDDDPLYERACAPAWTAAQEYDAAGSPEGSEAGGGLPDFLESAAPETSGDDPDEARGPFGREHR